MTRNGKREVVVITGASAGVGRATVRRFAAEGVCLGLIARGRDGLEAARAEVEQAGGRALVLPLDVADADAVDAAASAVEEAFGPIDVWINNAMVSVFSPVRETTPAEYRRVTEVSYLGYVHGTLSALRRMLPRDRGHIVQVGSALAYRAIPLQSAYCAAKHAIQGFSEALRCELLHDGSHVRVTQVHLPAVNTPQFDWVRSRLPRRPQPVPPIFQPEVAAEAIHWAAHGNNPELYVGAPTVKAVMAQRISPRLADHYAARTGVDAQQTDEPAGKHREDNLFDALPGDHGAHGSFGDDARSRSLQFELVHRRRWLALAAAGLAGAAGTVLALRPLLR